MKQIRKVYRNSPKIANKFFVTSEKQKGTAAKWMQQPPKF